MRGKNPKTSQLDFTKQVSLPARDHGPPAQLVVRGHWAGGHLQVTREGQGRMTQKVFQGSELSLS